MRIRMTAAWLVCLFIATPRAEAAGVPPNTPSVASATLPIRVYYDNSTTLAVAQKALLSAEHFWTTQVNGIGFAAPQRLVNGVVEDGFDVFLTTAPANASYTFQVLGDNPATPLMDCPTLGIVESSLMSDPDFIADATAHLLNHAALHAIDCIEPQLPAYDIFSIGVQLATDEIAAFYRDYLLSAFQSLPEWPLDRVGDTPGGMDRFYSFGASLYGLFLEERFGHRDGKLLAEIWRHTPQNGHITGVDPQSGEVAYGDAPNSPTYFDAIAQVLASKGSTFDRAYAEFAVWRFLVGSYADGTHFRDAAKYPAVTVAGQHKLGELPIASAQPTRPLGRYGSSYILLDPAGVAPNRALRVSFLGQSGFRWAAQAICVRKNAPAEVVDVVSDLSFFGTGYVPDLSRCATVALAVENLTDGHYDPNLTYFNSYPNPNWNMDSTYGYSFSDMPMPTISELSPSSLPRGAKGMEVMVRGVGLVDQPSLAAVFSGEGVTIDTMQLLNDSTLALQVSVSTDAALEKRDLAVTMGANLTAKLDQALLITPVAKGCSCSAPLSESGAALLVFLPVLFARGRARRRRIGA